MDASFNLWKWCKTFRKRHWLITGIALIYVVWSVFWWAVFTPIRNPWPQESYTIKGRFPFDKGYELMFHQTVYGASLWHQHLCGGGIFYLMGVQTSDATCSAGNLWTKPRQLDGQHYEVTLYRDVYFSGPQSWKVKTWHTQYKSNVGVDYTKVLVTDYGAPENSACDGSEESIRKFKGELFCTKQTGHKDFKHLVIHEGQPAGSNEKIQNFWLESELEQMLSKRP